MYKITWIITNPVCYTIVKWDFHLAKTGSIGFKSGLYGGRNHSRAATPLTNCTWACRLQTTLVMPGTCLLTIIAFVWSWQMHSTSLIHVNTISCTYQPATLPWVLNLSWAAARSSWRKWAVESDEHSDSDSDGTQKHSSATLKYQRKSLSEEKTHLFSWTLTYLVNIGAVPNMGRFNYWMSSWGRKCVFLRLPPILQKVIRCWKLQN